MTKKSDAKLNDATPDHQDAHKPPQSADDLRKEHQRIESEAVATDANNRK